MPVIALQSHDLHRDALHTQQAYPSDLDDALRDNPAIPEPKGQSNPPAPSPMPPAPSSVPISTQPLPPVDTQNVWNGENVTESPEAGPSHHHHHHHHHHRHERQPSIPPPANPRRHRSGVLMSQVRSRTQTGGSLRSGTSSVASKSFGDLSLSGIAGFTMSAMEPAASGSREHSATREGRRITSEGSRRTSVENEEAIWDNSARFYHHLHTLSRPASRQTSPERHASDTHSRDPSPSQGSAASSPTRSRRAAPSPHPLPVPHSALSPSHAFLQSHLPPLFHPSPGSSPDDRSLVAPSQSMVILTPTTAEWKEIKREARGELERVDSSDDTSSSSDRRSSIVSSSSEENIQNSLLLRKTPATRRYPKRPSLSSAVSADYLSRENTHTPDPGASPTESTHLTPSRPIFHQNVIAPSPIMPETERMVTSPLPERVELGHNQGYNYSGSSDDIIITPRESNGDSPQRFNSIGRRESLRAVPKPQMGERKKTKREMERERLFKDLDEELENEKGSTPTFEPVTEIGQGLKLDLARPMSLDSWSHTGSSQDVGQVPTRIQPDRSVTAPALTTVSPPAETPGQTDAKESVTPPSPSSPTSQRSRTSSTSPAKSTGISVSPSQPIKPSPLHATTPFTADLASPDEAPVDTPSGLGLESPDSQPSRSRDRTTSNHAANLDTIRHYARSLVEPEEPSKEIPNPLSPTLEAKSPRVTHRRDTKRVSLVAGRVVQPFTVPPDTALPPPAISVESDKPVDRKSPLTSFSPFRPGTGSINALSALPPSSRSFIPPSFSRQDSTISVAPSIAPPSEPGTPSSETAGGLGGRGINDYVIIKEAGKGAYGLVMRAKVKGPSGEPVGEEVIIKYIVKARILADCWKKHKVLGPIPVEIHVMDQLRHLMYHVPAKPAPWDPSRPHPGAPASSEASDIPTKRPVLPPLQARLEIERPDTPDSARSSPRSFNSSTVNPVQKYITTELKVSPARGHPNICKLLDFFEDREFYYRLDLFDRVEASPNGLPVFEIRSLVGQLADAIRFLHINGIVHRDIKDENVILDGQGRCQLIDFGSAAHWRPGKRWDTFSGTLHYASPEILRGDMYGGKEQDVYALGTVLYVLLVGETPFADLPDEVLVGLADGSKAMEALKERCEGKVGPNINTDADGAAVVNGDRPGGSVDSEIEGEIDGGGCLADAKDLVRRCLELEVADRPTAEIICQHRFLKGQGGWTGYRGWQKPKSRDQTMI